jgi:hypothetical protein
MLSVIMPALVESSHDRDHPCSRNTLGPTPPPCGRGSPPELSLAKRWRRSEGCEPQAALQAAPSRALSLDLRLLAPEASRVDNIKTPHAWKFGCDGLCLRPVR